MERNEQVALLPVVEEGGFEPPKQLCNRFTVCPIWPLWNSSVLSGHRDPMPPHTQLKASAAHGWKQPWFYGRSWCLLCDRYPITSRQLLQNTYCRNSVAVSIVQLSSPVELYQCCYIDWCRWRDSNPYAYAREPKPRMSTNFITSAYLGRMVVLPNTISHSYHCS